MYVTRTTPATCVGVDFVLNAHSTHLAHHALAVPSSNRGFVSGASSAVASGTAAGAARAVNDPDRRGDEADSCSGHSTDADPRYDPVDMCHRFVDVAMQHLPFPGDTHGAAVYDEPSGCATGAGAGAGASMGAAAAAGVDAGGPPAETSQFHAIGRDDLLQLLEACEGRRTTAIVATGGQGKTVLSSMLAVWWSKRELARDRVLLRLSLRDLATVRDWSNGLHNVLERYFRNALSSVRSNWVSTVTPPTPDQWEQVLSSDEIGHEFVNNCQKRRLLLVCDGWDDLTMRASSAMERVLNDAVAHHASVITLRPHALDHLLDVAGPSDVTWLGGFGLPAAERYIRLSYRDLPGAADKLVAALRSSPDLALACAVPIQLRLLCEHWGRRCDADVVSLANLGWTTLYRDSVTWQLREAARKYFPGDALDDFTMEAWLARPPRQPPLRGATVHHNARHSAEGRLLHLLCSLARHLGAHPTRPMRLADVQQVARMVNGAGQTTQALLTAVLSLGVLQVTGVSPLVGTEDANVDADAQFGAAGRVARATAPRASATRVEFALRPMQEFVVALYLVSACVHDDGTGMPLEFAEQRWQPAVFPMWSKFASILAWHGLPSDKAGPMRLLTEFCRPPLDLAGRHTLTPIRLLGHFSRASLQDRAFPLKSLVRQACQVLAWRHRQRLDIAPYLKLVQDIPAVGTALVEAVQGDCSSFTGVQPLLDLRRPMPQAPSPFAVQHVHDMALTAGAVLHHVTTMLKLPATAAVYFASFSYDVYRGMLSVAGYQENQPQPRCDAATRRPACECRPVTLSDASAGLLTEAAINDEVSVVTEFLAAAGVEHNLQSALFAAACSGAVKVVAHLTHLATAGGYNICSAAARDGAGATPLFAAAANGHTSCVALLLQVPDVSCHQPRTDGATPLLAACINSHADVVAHLLRCDGVAEHINDMCTVGGETHGVTVLGAAMDNVLAGDGARACAAVNIVQQLLRHERLRHEPGLDVNKESSGCTALYKAVCAHNTDVLQDILAFPGVRVNKRSGEDCAAPLHAAVRENNVQALELLLARDDIDVSWVLACHARRHHSAQTCHCGWHAQAMPSATRSAALSRVTPASPR